MCTAIHLIKNGHYFGRNLDLEYHYNEAITVTPRNFDFKFKAPFLNNERYAIIGMATTVDGYPLYYDACNEAGLAMAGLNFPGCAQYQPIDSKKDNTASFEFIPWILSTCRTVKEARALLQNTNVCSDAFSPELPPSPLHWMISDAETSIVVEPLQDGLRIFDNPLGVMTNGPSFDYHLMRLRDFTGLSPDMPENTFIPALDLAPYSRGMGTMGLPGDWSSVSRFIRAAYLRAHSSCAKNEASSIAQFFRILGAVSHVRGSVRVKDRYEITQYTSCCCTEKGLYFYTTYENQNLTAVDLHRENLDSEEFIEYPMMKQPEAFIQNRR